MKSMKRSAWLITAGMLLISSPVSVHAQSRCPAGDSGCTADNYGDRMRSIVSGETQEFLGRDSTYETGQKAIRERAKGVKEILQKCIECSLDAAKDAGSRVLGGSGSSTR